MEYQKSSIQKHKKWKGKLEIVSRVDINDTEALSLAYTPGVAGPCLEIQKNINLSYEYTRRWNMVAVVTDGTAVLGLGDIGPEAGMPVMEGKCILFKTLGDIDAFPLCIKSKDITEIVNTVALLEGNFGGINLEDIAAPRCFQIERLLKEKCSIPIFHDDQHGTAVVVLAATINALKIIKKDISKVRIVVSGAGAAGIAITKLLLKAGAENIILCDSTGIIHSQRDNLTYDKKIIAQMSNPMMLTGSLKDALVNADIFIGVSAPNIVTEQMVRSMAKDPVIFAMSNPIPEVLPDVALAGGAKIIGTGRSDFPNQINNVLAFPGIFRGTLDVRAQDINDHMKMAAANAIASIVSESELCAQYIIPSPLDKRVVPTVAHHVSKAAIESGIAKLIL